MTNYRSKSTLALAAMIALPVLSWAGTAEKAKAADAPAEKINSSAITGDIGVSVMSSSYSRGGILWNHAPTVLPYIDLFATAYEGDGLISKAVLSLNVTEYYARISKNAPFTTTGDHRSWYENDFVPGIALTSGKFTLSESYHIYEEPNSAGGSNDPRTFMGINSSLSYDDGDLLGAFALHPALTYMQRINGHGSYYEVTGGPGFTAGPVSVALPLTAGFSSDNFYGVDKAKNPKDGFAYFAAGLKFTYTLPMPKTYGTWSANTGVTYYQKEKKVIGCNESSDVVLSGGVQVNF